MTKGDELALARLKHLYDEAVDAAFYLEHSGNHYLEGIGGAIKITANWMFKLHQQAQLQQQKHEQNQH
jgi:hypothetical protein